MRKTYVNALVFDKGEIGVDSVVRDSLQTFYQRNMYIDSVQGNPLQSIIEDTEDKCLEKASESNFDYLVLTWEGNIIDIHTYHHECINYINELGDDWLVAGHIMNQHLNRLLYSDPKADDWKNSFWLFPITAVVNVKMWEKLGKPKWGQASGVQTVTKAVPDENCVHDDYTPLLLTAGDQKVSANTKKGWNIIDTALANGMKVFNLSNGIRNSQTYLYPENDVDRYNKYWQSLYMMPKLTDQYKKVLEKILPSKYPRRINDITWQCFIRNTENYFPEEVNYPVKINWEEIDTIALPSSGFKDFIVSMGKNSARKTVDVVHFDIIRQCTEIRRKMIERWDGSRETFSDTLLGIGKEYRTDPLHAFHMHSMKDVIEAYEHLLPFFNSEEDLKECWQKFKSFKHSYIEADLLDDPWPAIKLIKNKRLYICLSDIAGWRNNIIGYGYKNLRNDIAGCVEKLSNRGITGYVDYKDPGTDLQMWQTLEDALTHLKQ
jgi:hypothetical protein